TPPPLKETLTAYLTVCPLTQLPIRTLEDVLANRTTKSWSPREPTYTRKSCSTRPRPYYELRKQMKVVDSMPICSQTPWIRTPTRCASWDQNINIHFYNAYCNKVYIADQTFNAYSLGVAFPKGAFYLPAFSF
uniref:Kringle domain-containing protein n=1 Tax=Macrostomum lignano TaxID=282301 RepID=A0A1I8F9F9_9PLAT